MDTTQLLQIDEMYNEFQLPEQYLEKELIQYSTTKEYNNYKLSIAMSNQLATHEVPQDGTGSYLTKVIFNNTFAVDLLSSCIDNWLVPFFKKQESQSVFMDFCHVFSMNESGCFVKLDLSCSSSYYGIGCPVQQQFGSDFQKEALAGKSLSETYVSQEYDQQKRWADVCLRPEALLSDRENKWKICWKSLHEIGEFEGKVIILKYCDEDYSSVRIFKKLLSLLERMIKILPYPKVEQQLKNKRYDLEYLRPKSHLLTV